jgi:hypothetical protein
VSKNIVRGGRQRLAIGTIACMGVLVFAEDARAQILTDDPPPARPQPVQPPPPPPQPVQPPPRPVQPAPVQPVPVQPQPAPVPPAPVQPPPPAPVQPPPPAPVQPPTPPPSDVPSGPAIDHDRFVGHFAIGYMGISQLPIASPTSSTAVVNAPVIGGRYWFRREIGIDAGIGFAFQSGSAEVSGVSTDTPSQTGFVVHAGAPINFAYGKHYVFQVVPEMNLGFTGGSIKGKPDTSLTGFRFDLGARAGAEIHFGFIGIPELALQASIGLYIRREARSATPDGGQSSGVSSTTFATSVQADPWALFSNNISALYYF